MMINGLAWHNVRYAPDHQDLADLGTHGFDCDRTHSAPSPARDITVGASSDAENSYVAESTHHFGRKTTHNRCHSMQSIAMLETPEYTDFQLAQQLISRLWCSGNTPASQA